MINYLFIELGRVKWKNIWLSVMAHGAHVPSSPYTQSISTYYVCFLNNIPPLEVCVIVQFPDNPPLAAAWLLIWLNGLFSILVFTCCRPSIISSLCASSSSLLDNSDLFLTSPRILWATSGTFSFCQQNKRVDYSCQKKKLVNKQILKEHLLIGKQKLK